MYYLLLPLHSLFRWIVLGFLILAVYKGFRGWSARKPFSAADNRLRHYTATIAHVQLVLGYLLYFQSPFIQYFREHYRDAVASFAHVFFGIIHIVLMTIAVVFITIGSSLAKRKNTDHKKFGVMTLWFVLALLVIFLAIPWPFSPLARRPYFRSF